MKLVRKSLAIAAVAFGAAFLAPVAAQAHGGGDRYSADTTYECDNGGDQASAYNIGLLNGNNVQVPINADLNAVLGLGLLGVAAPSGGIVGC